MDNSKQLLSFPRYIFFSIAIVLGVYLSVEEYTFANNIRNSIIFFFASIFIFFVEIVLLYGDLFKINNLSFRDNNKPLKKSFLFNAIFLPIVNLIILMIYGLSGGTGFDYLISSLITFIGFVFLFNYIHSNHEEEMKNKAFEGVGTDIHKLILVYLLAMTVHNLFRESLSLWASFIAYLLFFIILFFLLLTINYYRRNSKNEIFINAAFGSYVSSLTLLILNIVFESVPSYFIGLYVLVVLYSILALTETYYETNKLESSVLGKYLSMVLLATAILILGS